MSYHVYIMLTIYIYIPNLIQQMEINIQLCDEKIHSLCEVSNILSNKKLILFCC